jgi:hypothetical protein
MSIPTTRESKNTFKRSGFLKLMAISTIRMSAKMTMVKYKYGKT